MSRLFNTYYSSAANNYGCEETYRQREEDKINAAWELHEAGEDLAKGIVDDNVPEFVWPE